MKYPKIIKKMTGLMLASISVGALALSPVAYAAPASSSETFEASGVKNINVTTRAKTVKVEPSSDNSVHVSSAMRAVKSGSVINVIFLDQEEIATIQIPTSLTDASLMIRPYGKTETITIKDITVKDITIAANGSANIAINNVSVPAVNLQAISGNVTVDAKNLKKVYAFSRQGNVTVKTDVNDITNIFAKSIEGNVEVTVPSSTARSTENSKNNDKVTAQSVKGKAEVKTK